jgi:hypothetical protein
MMKAGKSLQAGLRLMWPLPAFECVFTIPGIQRAIFSLRASRRRLRSI